MLLGLCVRLLLIQVVAHFKKFGVLAHSKKIQKKEETHMVLEHVKKYGHSRNQAKKPDYKYKRRDGTRILGAWTSWFLFKEKKTSLLLAKNASVYETLYVFN